MTLKRLGMIALIFALVSVLALSAGTTVAQAQAECAKTAGVSMINLESSTASIIITAYNNDGTQNGTTTSDTIAANDSTVYFPIPNIDAGFSGSLVVSSDRDVAAIANIVCTDFSAGGSYNAGTGGSTTVNLPLLFFNNSGYYSQFSVQNAGGDDAVVNVQYSDGTSAGPDTIAPGAAKVYDQRNESHPQAIFAAKVTSDGEPILAAVLQEKEVINAYTGAIGGGDANPVFPLVNANNSNIITGIQIQNTGSQSTDVTVSYTPSTDKGTACTETQTIAGGGSNTFALAAFSGNPNPAIITTNCANGATFIGSAEVTSNSNSQPLLGLVNQLVVGTYGESYSSFSKADATNTVVMPLIMDRNSGFWTGFNVVNVGTSSTDVSCDFVNTNYSIPATTLAPGQALTDLQKNEIADGYIGAGTCTTSDSSGKIVAIVNQLRDGFPGDVFYVYEGINR